jgi:N6-L-threonylcarbamoyladenine synthase
VYYLAIETSCDETSLAVLQSNLADKARQENFYDYLNSFSVPSWIVSSQIEVHKQYGGVVPEIGARQHSQQIHSIFKRLLEQLYPSRDFPSSLDNFCKNLAGIFVTNNPGLKSALRVGMEFAKTIQFYADQKTGSPPFLNFVNHLDGHLHSCFFHPKNLNTFTNEKIFPHLHLLVSGGNSQILFLENPKRSRIIGSTLDDAAGECMDKIGRMLGLPYPGGVWLSKIAKNDQNNYQNLTVGMSSNDKIAYSFSGLKTAIRTRLEKIDPKIFVIENPLTKEELDTLLEPKNLNPKLELIYKTCVSVQFVVVQQLINKMKLALDKYQPKSLGLSGGVSANKLLQYKLGSLSNLPVFMPEPELTGDNATMIGLAGLVKTEHRKTY